jgi:hypothetical protein
VRGPAIFDEWFKDFENQYVLIGGTAASITMDEAGVPFRGTTDEPFTWPDTKKFGSKALTCFVLSNRRYLLTSTDKFVKLANESEHSPPSHRPCKQAGLCACA